MTGDQLTRRTVVLGGGVGLALAATPDPWALAGSAAPFVLPGLKRWHAGAGSLRLGRRVDVVVPHDAADDLVQVAHRLAPHLRARGRPSRIRHGRPGEGDVALSLGRR